MEKVKMGQRSGWYSSGEAFTLRELGATGGFRVEK